jgi:chromosomal replication initiator protein
MSADLWQRGCERLAAELPEQQFNTWIRPLPAADVTDQGISGAVASLRVPNRFKLDWIRNQYAGRIEAVLSELAGKPVRLDLMLAPRDNPLPVSGFRSDGPVPIARALGPARSSGIGHGGGAEVATLGVPTIAVPRSPSAANAALPRHRLNPALTFGSLVAGRANQMARTAALHVAGAPGQMYNPLFIYGGVGLGKTHLVHAVGNALLADRADARVLYLHAEQFITDVVKNYQRKTFVEL